MGRSVRDPYIRRLACDGLMTAFVIQNLWCLLGAFKADAL